MLKRWRFAWAWFVGAVLITMLAACAWPPWNPSPVPTPTPTPPPPVWECPLPYPSCDKTEPPQQCSSVESPCWHNPTQNPEHCEEAPKCHEPPPPLPQPQCETFTDRGGTLRVLGENCDCYFGQAWNPCGTQCAAEADLVVAACGGAIYNATVKQGTDALGDLTGGDPQENLKILAAKIEQQTGRECIFGGIEALFLLRPDGLYEENHSVFFGNGSWTGNGFGKFKGCHEDVDPTEPPPAGECPAPHPDLARMKFRIHEKGNHLDTTWTTVNQEPFCREIGMSPMADGTPRAGCPVRPEGNEERFPCEMDLCDQKWQCNGVPIEGWRGNPAQTNCRGHWKTWCSADGSTAIAEGNR